MERYCKAVSAKPHQGESERWFARPDAEWIDLARTEATQWLVDRGYDLDTLTVHDAIEALAHDYQSFKIID